MISNKEFFNQNIVCLVEARKRWNSLSDKIYAIAGGDLENSEYFIIYNYYEIAVKDSLINLVPENYTNFIQEFFTVMILEFVENGYICFQDKNETTIPIINPIDIPAAIINYNANFIPKMII